MNIYAVKNLITEIASQLEPRCTSKHNAEREAWWLLEKLTGRFEAELMTEDFFFLSDDQDHQLYQWIEARVKDKKPLQYILGTVPFGFLDIMTIPPILIPRPETEEIVAWIIAMIKKSKQDSLRMLDLCTGSGCIALNMAKAFPRAEVIGSDINPAAVALAEKNKKLNNVVNVRFYESDLFTQLKEVEKFDVIISNPPYLSEKSYQEVSDEIRLWEDPRALIADHQGMELYEKILIAIGDFLKKPATKTVYPQLVFEIGIDQKKIATLVKQAGFSTVEIYNDLAGLPRWLAAWY